VKCGKRGKNQFYAGFWTIFPHFCPKTGIENVVKISFMRPFEKKLHIFGGSNCGHFVI